MARTRRRAYRAEPYWGRPVPGFGDPRARIVLVGLAPGAHGANRTGRMFTGDGTGDFLYAALFRAGLASSPLACSAGDGLVLRDVFLSNACRCAPPGNHPSPAELARCAPFLDREIRALRRTRVVVALGAIAWAATLAHLRRGGAFVPRPAPAFGHGAEVRLDPGPALLASYHPSRQNTNTGRLTAPMFDAVIARAVALAGE